MTRKDATKIFVRFLVVFGMCVPLFIIIGILLGDGKSGFLETFIYVVVGGLFVLIEEYFYWRAWKKRMIAKSQTTPEKYFAELRKIQMKKKNIPEQVVEKKEKPKNQQKNNVKKININKGRKK